jgi:hypothetical protein
MDGWMDGWCKKFCVPNSQLQREGISTIHLTSQLLSSKGTGLLTDWLGGFLKGAMDILKSG